MTTSTTPTRIQRRRTKGWRKPEGAVIVTRPSKWGNPYIGDPATAAARYRVALRECLTGVYRPDTDNRLRARRPFNHPELLRAALVDELAGRDLACYCPPLDADGVPVPCHVDVLIEFVAEVQR